MKKMIFTLFVSIVLSAPAFAGEEIKLAAAIGSGTTSGAVPCPTCSGAIGSGTAATTATTAATATAAGLSTASMVAVGVIGAGALAAIASGGSTSTSNH